MIMFVQVKLISPVFDRAGCLKISDLDILVLHYVSALYSQLAGLGIKINSLNTQGKCSPNSGAAHASSRRLCLHLPGQSRLTGI